MKIQGIGAPARRVEDAQLLTGQAQFTDDVALPGMVHAAFKRSPHAHARIGFIDLSAAWRLPGVIAIFTARDLGDFWQPSPLLVPPPPLAGSTFNQRTAGQLARDVVRYAGEPVAMVVAENRYLAEDALDAIRVEYEPLPPVVGLREALAGAALVHPDVGSNVAAHVVQTKGDYERARAGADRVIAREFAYDRGTAAPIEARAVVAQFDRANRQLTVWDSTQAPIPVRNGLAQMLGLSERQVRVIARFVGGGFGPKLMAFFPEETLVPWAAMRLGVPIKWVEDRRENFLHMPHERGQIHESELAISADGRILGIKDVFLQDSGAYNPYGMTIPINSQCTLLGPYVVPSYYSEFTSLFTNKTIVTPYRGAGRQPGVFVVERLLDLAARELDLDPAEIRRRNLIQPDQFPWSNEIMYQDFTTLTYDSGDYPAVLEKTQAMIGWDEFRETEGPRLRAEGRKVGIGLVMYVEGSGIGPYEGARVQVEPTGKVTVVTGIGTQGQGHYTIFAQIAADVLGLDIHDIYVSTGDSGQFNWGTGTFASRGAVVAGSAVYAAACKVREKALALAAEEFGVAEDAIELGGGEACVRGQPERRISLAALAARANPLRGAVTPGTEPGMEATMYFGPAMGATSAGAHAMIVEVEPETFNLRILRYVVVHDCGTLLNPLLVEGQIHGGVAQGIGNAFFEQLRYDERGLLLNASFQEYLLPLATDVPRIDVGHLETPSPLNPLGTKGTGEAGAIPVGALFAQALEDALRDTGIEIREIPLSADRLWQLAAGAPKPAAE
ncbi:MAG TPA: xanthine dehydrogenase family protein molybdopterin-binding subunit [Herpetosiphonaceae bacterium]